MPVPAVNRRHSNPRDRRTFLDVREEISACVLPLWPLMLFPARPGRAVQGGCKRYMMTNIWIHDLRRIHMCTASKNSISNQRIAAAELDGPCGVTTHEACLVVGAQVRPERGRMIGKGSREEGRRDVYISDTSVTASRPRGIDKHLPQKNSDGNLSVHKESQTRLHLKSKDNRQTSLR